MVRQPARSVCNQPGSRKLLLQWLLLVLSCFSALRPQVPDRPIDVPSGVKEQSETALEAARRLTNGGKYKAAEVMLHKLVEEAPNSADAHYLLAATLFHLQQPKISLAEYTTAARLRRPTTEELIGVASDYILLEDYTDATRWLKLVTEQSPRLPLGWYLLGRTEYNDNNMPAAEQAFAACLRLEPRHVRAEYNLGLVYEKTERYELAVQAYRQAITWQAGLRNFDPQPYLDLGSLLRHQGHAEEALPYLERAAHADETNPMAHQEFALGLEAVGRYDEAIGELKRAVGLVPDSESLHFFLGRIYRRQGQADAAAKEFAEASRLAGTQSSRDVVNSGGLPGSSDLP